MRILIVSQYYRPAYSFGGAVQTAVTLAEGLARIGHEVSVATTTRLDVRNRPPRRSRTENISGVTVYYLGVWWRFRKSNLNPAIVNFMLPGNFGYDVLHVIGLYDSLGPCLASVARWRRVPYTIQPAGMLIAGKRTLCGKRLYHNLVGRRYLSGAEAVVVTSSKEWDDAIHFGIKPEYLLLRRQGMDMSEYKCLPPKGRFRQQWGIPDAVPLILWLGRIDPIKNLEQLLAALSGLIDLPWRLCIVGPTETPKYLDSLKRMASQLAISSRVQFVPPLYGPEKLAAFADAYLLALVSLSENWGNSAQSAVAAGVPVLITKTCGFSEIIERGGGLSVLLGIDPIREGLRRLLLDSEFYQLCKSQLPSLVVAMPTDEQVLQMANLFEDLIHQ